MNEVETTVETRGGREGGPLGFLHGPEGLMAIGEDGWPLTEEELLELEEPQRRELERYAVIYIEPVAGS